MKQRTRLEMVGTQALLAGVTFAAERAIELLNDIRAELDLPLMGMETNGVLATVREPALLGPDDNKERVKRKHTRRSKPPGSGSGPKTARRWRIVKAAGLYKGGSGSPSGELVERATKLLRARGQWPLPGEEEEEQPRAIKLAAKTFPDLNLHEPEAPVWDGKRHMSKTAKKRLGTSTQQRWDTVKAAGVAHLSHGKLPTNKLLAKAEAILAKRKEQTS